ncbi:MAG: DUF6531 domain-containing protein [Thermodesulfobacteriota bacterium]
MKEMVEQIDPANPARKRITDYFYESNGINLQSLTIAQTNNDVIKTPSTADPVSTVTGNNYHDETDLTIKGRGLDIAFTRTYNSGPVIVDARQQFDMPGMRPLVGGIVDDQHLPPVLVGQQIENGADPCRQQQEQLAPVVIGPLQQAVGGVLAEPNILLHDAAEKVFAGEGQSEYGPEQPAEQDGQGEAGKIGGDKTVPPEPPTAFGTAGRLFPGKTFAERG